MDWSAGWVGSIQSILAGSVELNSQVFSYIGIGVTVVLQSKGFRGCLMWFWFVCSFVVVYAMMHTAHMLCFVYLDCIRF